MDAIIIIIGILSIFTLAYFITKKKEKPQPAHVDLYAEYDQREDDLKDFIARLNMYRVGIGVQVLIRNKTLSNAAFKHCKYMFDLKRANHDGVLKRRVNIIGMGFKNYGEIVANDYTKNSSMLAAYLKSEEDHKEAIENPLYDVVGISTIHDGKKKYNVTIFSKK